jgi:hypothetical protein
MRVTYFTIPCHTGIIMNSDLFVLFFLFCYYISKFDQAIRPCIAFTDRPENHLDKPTGMYVPLLPHTHQLIITFKPQLPFSVDCRLYTVTVNPSI